MPPLLLKWDQQQSKLIAVQNAPWLVGTTNTHSFLGMPKSSALTMLGAALGMSASGPSTKGSMSGLVQTGCCLMQAATLQAAMVACKPPHPISRCVEN